MRFGSLAAVVEADAADLAPHLGGRTDAGELLTSAKALIRAAMFERVVRSPIMSADADLNAYLVARLRSLRQELLLAIFADTDRGFIAEEVIALGEVCSVSCHPRTLFTRALALDSRAILLVHNHPSGSPEPSEHDVRSTERLARQAEMLDIELIDHLIVGGPSVLSMRRAGLLGGAQINSPSARHHEPRNASPHAPRQRRPDR